MRQSTVAHEQAIGVLFGRAGYLQMLVDSLGAATSVQGGRVAGLEQHTAQLQFFIEAFRVGQEEQQSGAAPLPPADGSGRQAKRKRLPSRRRFLWLPRRLRRPPDTTMASTYAIPAKAATATANT